MKSLNEILFMEIRIPILERLLKRLDRYFDEHIAPILFTELVDVIPNWKARRAMRKSWELNKIEAPGFTILIAADLGDHKCFIGHQMGEIATQCKACSRVNKNRNYIHNDRCQHCGIEFKNKKRPYEIVHDALLDIQNQNTQNQNTMLTTFDDDNVEA
jgi:hypothetical protein